MIEATLNEHLKDKAIKAKVGIINYRSGLDERVQITFVNKKPFPREYRRGESRREGNIGAVCGVLFSLTQSNEIKPQLLQ
jgi:hypothetical protein